MNAIMHKIHPGTSLRQRARKHRNDYPKITRQDDRLDVAERRAHKHGNGHARKTTAKELAENPGAKHKATDKQTSHKRK